MYRFLANFMFHLENDDNFQSYQKIVPFLRFNLIYYKLQKKINTLCTLYLIYVW